MPEARRPLPRRPGGPAVSAVPSCQRPEEVGVAALAYHRGLAPCILRLLVLPQRAALALAVSRLRHAVRALAGGYPWAM
eukprot:1625526-Prymnesium_polylepis.1